MIGHIRNYYRKVPVSVKKGLILALITFITFDLIFFGGIKSACQSLSDNARSRKRNYKYSQLPGRPKKKLKIAILTYYSNDRYGNELRQLTWTNKQKYAADHGYDVFDINSIPSMAARLVEEREKMHNFFFYKYLAIAEAFKGLMSSKRYDYVVWSDPDAIYLNYSKRYEDIIDERFDVIVTTGPPNHPQWGLVVNTGGFIVKNSEFGARFLEEVLYMSQNHCGEFLLENPEAGSPLNGWLQVCGADGAYWLSDQGIIQALFSFKKSDYKCHIKKTWMRAFNSEFPWYGQGDLAVHFPGRGLEEKKKLIKAFVHHLDVSTGKLRKGVDESLKSDHSLTADLIQLEQKYQQHNSVCAN